MARPSAKNSTAAVRRRSDGVGLRDVAKQAAVDISTASRALNHDPRVNPERAQQIRRLAERMGYRPRPLRSKLARSVGVLVMADRAGQPQNHFLERVAWLAQRSLAERQLHVNLECIPREQPAVVPAVVQQNRVDGVLLAGHPPADLVAEIRALGMPAVAINDSIERLGISCVRSNPEPAIRQAILHLAARGHESFALLGSDPAYPTNQARHHAYELALREIGIEPKPDWFVTGLPGDIIGGRQGIRQLKEHGRIPTAILCENDWMAVGAMQELQRLGLNIPRDVSLVGHDDLWICEQLEPPLTSIRRAEDELLSRAIDLLIEQIENRVPATLHEVLVEGEMVWRQTAGPAPGRLRDRSENGTGGN